MIFLLSGNVMITCANFVRTPDLHVLLNMKCICTTGEASPGDSKPKRGSLHIWSFSPHRISVNSSVNLLHMLALPVTDSYTTRGQYLNGLNLNLQDNFWRFKLSVTFSLISNQWGYLRQNNFTRRLLSCYVHYIGWAFR